MLKAYLAGAIRTLDDYHWRAHFHDFFLDKLTSVCPSDIGVDDWGKLREFSGSALMTYKTDLALIDACDLVVANLEAFTDGYPCIGTLIEIGYAQGKGKPILVYAPERLRNHPFISFGCTGVFSTKEALYRFLNEYLAVMEGKCPLFPAKV